MSRRRSTIHDAAALRLHPNGVRVPLISPDVRNPTSSVVTTKDKAASLARKDRRGNWIATDAGGDGKVKKRRRVNEGSKQDEKERERSISGSAEATESHVEGSGMPSARVYKDARANRRVAFENDLTFLAAPSSAQEGSSTVPLQPTSDFLKCIHHFASQYYGFHDQLFDSAGKYRKEKKEKRRQRLLQLGVSESKEPESHSEGDEEKLRNSEPSEARPSTSKSKETHKGKGKAQPRVPTRKVTQRDMYKAFDGSALLCIGMLLQSHIFSSLADDVPDTWQDDERIQDADEPEGDTDSVVTEGEDANRSKSKKPRDEAKVKAVVKGEGTGGRHAQDRKGPKLVSANGWVVKDADEDERDHSDTQPSE